MEAVKCEAFLAAAELGSLTATAELLGYTQSGVTRMIGTLEEELGFPLFLRSKKGVQLTENGKLMLPLLREVVRAHHNAEQLSAEIGGVSKGSLTIGCYYSISALWMPEILTAFRARYPGVTVRMQEGGNLEMARWLNERSVDCCFGAQMHGDKYDWLPVFRDELVAWLPRGHELAEADAFVIGGAQVYRLLLPACRRLYVTQIDADGGADVFFPEPAPGLWRITEQSPWQEEQGLRYRYLTYERKDGTDGI